MVQFRDYNILKVQNLIDRGLDGECDFDRRTILIGSHCRGLRELETLIHEMIHAADPDAKEKVVHEIAKDMARSLWKLGYRKRSPVSKNG